MTIYAMTFNELPFKVGLGIDTHHAIQDLEFNFKNENVRSVTPSLQSFLLAMLEKTPQLRAKIDDL